MAWDLLKILTVISILSFKSTTASLRPDNISCSDPNAHHSPLGDCCNGIFYTLGHHDVIAKKECNVAPANQSMDFVDSHWTFYQCVVDKMIVGKNLTLQNYADMMVKNLPNENFKAEILNKIKNLPPNYKCEGTRLEKLKKTWETFFDLSYEVCGKNFHPNEDQLVNTTARDLWEPSVLCLNRKLPIHFSSSDFNTTAFDNCYDFLKLHLKSETLFKDLETAVLTACMYATFNYRSIEEVLKSSSNVQTLFYQGVPAYLSKSAAAKIYQRVWESTTNSLNFTAPAEFLTKVVEYDPIPSECLKNEELQKLCTNLQSIKFVNSVTERVAVEMCGILQ